MTRRLIVRSVAERDLLDAYAWYEERTADLGADFLQRIDLALIHLTRHPSSGPLFYRKYRRMLIQRFPYGIFYVVTPEIISVVAVMHLAQNPAKIRKTLVR
jgi:plasmid stabilization system protein ParE